MNFKNFRLLLLALTANLLLTACSMMETDLSGCPTGLYVGFKYDYNVERADMFKDHVGGVSVYVFDEEQRFVMQKEVANSATEQPLKTYGYQLHFSEEELPAGSYYLLAVAQQKGYDETLATKGAKFRRTELQPGDAMNLLSITLDREALNAEGLAPVPHQGCPLDTLWTTRDADAQQVTLTKGCPTYHQLPLIRHTKQLNICLRELNADEPIRAEDYDVRIMHRNGRLRYNGLPDPEDAMLLYTPYAQWNTAPDDARRATQTSLEAANYELFLNRLTYHDAGTDNAHLVITHKTTGHVAVDIDLSRILSDGREYFELQRYSRQEFLDRENKYSLTFILQNGEWKEMQLRISVMDWAKRYQRVDF